MAVASDPMVSVLMAVYNERPYVKKAVQSVLDQTFEDFEFIIVNDGSTDGSKEILERFKDCDDRIRLIHQENEGLIASLNRGLDIARGQYIARMDGDDITHPERFERQVNFLESTPEIGVVGTQIKFINAEGRVTGHWPLPTDPDVVAFKFLFNTCLVNPTTMARHVLFEKLNGYADWAKHAEDYELWTRAVQKTRLVNLSDTLLKFRRHERSVTVSDRTIQIRTAVKAAANLHRTLLGSQADEQMSRFLAWMARKSIGRASEETGVRDFAAVHNYLRVLYEAFSRQLLPEGLGVQARRAALAKLDTLSEQFSERWGLGWGTLYKLRARFMAPVPEIIPWGVKAIRDRIG